MKYLWFLLLLPPVLFLIYVLFLTVCALFVNTKRIYDRDSRFYRRVLNHATGLAMWFLRVHIHVSGAEKLPQGRFLLVSNHRSNYDPLVTWYALRKTPLSFVSKESNFKIPIFGRLVRRCCFMPIDRENARSALLTVRRAAALLRDDVASVGIYPEGTRSKSGELLPFHDGIFLVAEKANVPIVVMTIRGTEKIRKQYIRHATHVYLDICTVIPAETVKSNRSSALAAMARETMESVLTPDKQKIEEIPQKNMC